MLAEVKEADDLQGEGSTQAVGTSAGESDLSRAAKSAIAGGVVVLRSGTLQYESGQRRGAERLANGARERSVDQCFSQQHAKTSQVNG